MWFSDKLILKDDKYKFNFEYKKYNKLVLLLNLRDYFIFKL